LTYSNRAFKKAVQLAIKQTYIPQNVKDSVKLASASSRDAKKAKTESTSDNK
jgi:hypothetical protein